MDTRRRSVLAAGAAGAVALVTGCGEGDGGDASTPQDPAEGATTPTDGASAPAPAGEELARTADIPVGGGTVFKEQEVVVTQPAAGQFKAFSAICTHQRCTVGSVSDGLINCPCHNSKFRIEDASVAAGPATRPLPAKQITVEGDSILLM
ncbi:Rieske (2Fe-2S) protein [Streptomyces sp. PKU-EA00015]|uniref:Rieske (2Fe-2S) protein n=1 Tax=Streptomyces sp. PKU-EA00015 TaxID=2748326 RepID=UPI0015A02243|nr:Rieske (2Fe-2S) protein [Streptomyces sp. PKU-EA00015]NWF28638.1 Rieske (2Fe-2S) protein [Streptomyces sp. PKU-EA00015]